MPIDATRRTNLFARVALACAVAHGVVLSNWLWGHLRLTDASANYLVVLIALLLSWTIVACAPLMPRRTLAWLVGISASLWATACSLLALFVFVQLLDVVRSGKDWSFERISSQNVGRHVLVTYRTNGGATTGFGIEVRDEVLLVPGVRRVVPVYGVYPGYQVSITPISDEVVRFESPPYGTRRTSSDVAVVRLERVPWF